MKYIIGVADVMMKEMSLYAPRTIGRKVLFRDFSCITSEKIVWFGYVYVALIKLCLGLLRIARIASMWIENRELFF